MKLGVTFPQFEIGSGRQVVREFVDAVQCAGYQYLSASDHVVGVDWSWLDPGPEGPADHTMPFYDPFPLLGYVAAVAPGLGLATAVVVLPQRQTVLVAKQAATLDSLSGGNLRLGVGVGWNSREYKALGVPWGKRGDRLEEQIALMRDLWQKPVVDFDGEFHSFRASGINPRGIQRPIPIWLGAWSEPGISRAARVADGIIATEAPGVPWEVTFGRMAEWLDREDRDPSQFGIEVRVRLSEDDPGAWRSQAERGISRGATHMTAYTLHAGLSAAGHAERIAAAFDVLSDYVTQDPSGLRGRRSGYRPNPVAPSSLRIGRRTRLAPGRRHLCRERSPGSSEDRRSAIEPRDRPGLAHPGSRTTSSSASPASSSSRQGVGPGHRLSPRGTRAATGLRQKAALEAACTGTGLEMKA